MLDVAQLLVPMRMLHRRIFRPEEARELERKKVFYRQFVQRGSLVFDIGANRGERTEVFLALGALVVAAEPVAHLAGELRYWIGNHRRFALEQKALGATEGTATMYVADLDVLSTLDPAWVDACRRQPHLSHARWNEETVQVTTLDRLIERHGTPSFAKIDVEGFEVEVLRGLSSRIPALSFEYTPYISESALECVERLRHFGPARFNASPGESLRMRYERWLDYEGITKFCREEMPNEPEYGDIYVMFEDA